MSKQAVRWFPSPLSPLRRFFGRPVRPTSPSKQETGRCLSLERLEERSLLSVTPVGSEFRFNDSATGVQTIPINRTIASDPAGNFVAVWQCNGQDGSGKGVYGQRYNAAGDAPRAISL